MTERTALLEYLKSNKNKTQQYNSFFDEYMAVKKYGEILK